MDAPPDALAEPEDAARSDAASDAPPAALSDAVVARPESERVAPDDAFARRSPTWISEIDAVAPDEAVDWRPCAEIEAIERVEPEWTAASTVACGILYPGAIESDEPDFASNRAIEGAMTVILTVWPRWVENPLVGHIVRTPESRVVEMISSRFWGASTMILALSA